MVVQPIFSDSGPDGVSPILALDDVARSWSETLFDSERAMTPLANQNQFSRGSGQLVDNNQVQLNTMRGIESEELGLLVQSLGKDRAQLSKALSDAIVASRLLVRAPRSRESREKAALAWRTIRGILSPSLTKEPQLAQAQVALTPELVSELESQHRAIRVLFLAVSSVQFLNDSDARVKEACRALRELALTLDDLIAGQRQKLLPHLASQIFALTNASKS